MKKLLGAILLILSSALPCIAQSTTVSGTITDSGGQVWANGTYKIQFNPNGAAPPYQWNGSPFTPSVYTGSLNSSGAFSGVVIPSNTFIAPGTMWAFTVCPAASSPCFSVSLPVQGATQNVTSSIIPPPIIVPANAYNQPAAYSDSEITGPVVGFSYFNLTSQTIRTCTVSIPCTWVSGSPGSGTVTEIDTATPITGGPIVSTGTIGLTVGSPCASGNFSTGLDSLLNSQCQPVPASGGGTPPYVGPTAVNGCGVEWTGLLTFTVGQCTYIINGITYNSVITNLTLAAADVTNPRIDAIIVDNTGTASAITGTPAGSPVDPTTDPSTQLALTFVEVAANATTPTGITSEIIYDENVEWNTTKGGTNSARVALASTNNPYRGSVDMEFGAGGTVTTTTFAEATKPSSATENLSTWNFIVFYIRNKAAWPTNRSVTIQWLNGATAVGTGVVLNNNNFGFNATTNVTTYQQIVIPTSYFQTGANLVTSIKFTVSGTGAALTGFYIDAVSLQAGTAPTPPLPTTLMNWRGTYSAGVQYNPNDTIVLNGCYFVALISNLNVAVSTTSTWAGIGSCATAKTGQLLTAQNGSVPVYLSPGIPPRAVTTGTDTILCDSSTALRDRGGWVLYTDSSGATVTVPDAGSTGCANNFLVGAGAGHGAGTITFNRQTSSQFFVLNGASAAAGATSFTLTAGQYATIKTDPDTTDWDVTITAGAGSGSVTSVVIAGTANQILGSGTCTITTTGTCTLSAITPFLLGTDNSVAGVLGLSNGSANAHTNWASGATTTNTIAGFTVVPTAHHLVACEVSGTTCTLTDSAITDASPTGTGAVVLANTPTLITPVIGAATGTSLLATGILDGTAPVTITTGNTGTPGGTYKSGYTVNQEATAATAITYTLPTAAAGLQYCMMNGYNGSAADTGTLTVQTSASGQYIYNLSSGTLSATGGYIISAGAAGDSICVVGIDSTHWNAYTQFGTWTVH